MIKTLTNATVINKPGIHITVTFPPVQATNAAGTTASATEPTR